MANNKLQPLIKYTGGKEKELKYILPNLPYSFDNYFEPFVGGGAVFAAIEAKHSFINDFSEELMLLYRNISSQNTRFFNYAEAIERTWENTNTFYENFIEYLMLLYNSYQSNKITKEQLKESLEEFCFVGDSVILSIIDNGIKQDTKRLVKEMQGNLYRKMLRMKVLDEGKETLSTKVNTSNIETAIKSAVYMYFRHLYNNKTIEDRDLQCALFLFIRNFCYSGMFRYNTHGEFNVPYGGMSYNNKTLKKKLQYYRSEELVSRLSNTTILSTDFEEFLRVSNPQENDFVFLDPPYDTEFSTYAQKDFNREDHARLANYMINECKAKWMLIIKNTEFVHSLYDKEGINIRSFEKEYLVNFKNRNDKKVTHLLITNY